VQSQPVFSFVHLLLVRNVNRNSFCVSLRPSRPTLPRNLSLITSCGGQYSYLTFARMPCLHRVKVGMRFCDSDSRPFRILSCHTLQLVYLQVAAVLCLFSVDFVCFPFFPASCTMGTRSFPGVKRPERGADHPPPFSAEVKKE
jgi:hypothetical protein